MTALSKWVREWFRVIVWAVMMVLAPIAALAAPSASLVMDARTGEVLYSKNADTRLHPASLTKMMTLYIAFEAIERGEISLDTMVTVSKHAASQPPSRLGLRAGQKIALRHLIRAAAIKSANDAATAIGEAISGSESAFAKRMNRTAKALGMSKSTFRNANGLTAEGHLSTARDMTILGRRLFYDFPQYYNIFSRKSADAGGATVASTNRRLLDSYEGADGIKTGYTGAAGFNLVASAHRGNKRIIATVFGAKSTPDRHAKIVELLDIGFGKAPNRANEQPPEPPVYMAEAESPEDDAVANAVATDVAEDLTDGGRTRGVAAGKTIRVAVAVTQSPRPRMRPERGTDAPAETVALAADATPAEDEVAAAEPAVAEGPAFVQSETPQPETMALAAQPPSVANAADLESNGGLATDEAALTAALAPAVAPTAEGITAPADGTAVAEAAPADTLGEINTDALVAEALGIALEDVVTETEEGQPATVSVASVDPEVRPAQRPAGTEASGATAADAAPSDDSPPAVMSEFAVAAPIANPSAPAAETDAPVEQILLVSADTSAEDEEMPLETVSRISTSGGSNWGISVGRFPTSYDAERALLQTALIEMETLDEALRKVASRKSGYDALFVGMTEETAALACRKLQARNAECTVLGPQG